MSEHPANPQHQDKNNEDRIGPPTEARTSTAACNSQCFIDALRSAGAWLDVNVDLVNALNVFPVPDGDTGTNMSLTMRAALAELDSNTYTAVSQVARVVAEGALMGARGNSGVILSQVLRGIARGLDGRKELQAVDLARALTEGAATAYKGVMKPVEGTMLTVAREAAEAAQRAAESGATPQETLEAALQEAQASLDRTPTLLPVLAEAGVVDSGGKGLVVLLEGASRYIHGEAVTTFTTSAGSAAHAHAPSDEKYNYDVQYLIQGTDLDVAMIREQIATMGDSVLVVGDPQTVKVHVHCDSPGEAIDFGITQGQVTSIIIENMQLQYEAFVAAEKVTAAAAGSNSGSDRSLPEQMSSISIIAVASGDGLCRVLESIGASAIVSGGQTMNPSTQDLIAAIERVPSQDVVLLPNNSNIILTARQAQQVSAKHVVVVPTRTVPQGIAALLAFNYQADLDENVALMGEAANAVETIEVTQAVRSAQVNGLAVRDGQIIGLVNGDLVTAGEDVTAVVADLLARVNAAEREILTIYYGEGVAEADAEALAEEMRGRYPDLEIEVLDGGQAHYHYVISAE